MANFNKVFSLFMAVGSILLAGCSSDDSPMVSLGIDDHYTIARMQKLRLSPALTGDGYSWKVDGEEVGTSKDHVFLFLQEGEHKVSFDVIDSSSPYHYDFTISVVHEEVEYSPYIATVYEFRPAPGQFVNEMPRYDEGNTERDMVAKVQECISGKNDVMISLGTFGGYVTFGFDHTCINVPGQKDFRIYGNAFYEGTGIAKGGSAEPGIVMVAFDANGNGIPDDPWYELAGSEYRNPLTIHNYSVTFNRGDQITWQDNQGQQGIAETNGVHKQPYYPQWLQQDSYTLTGTRLPNNATEMSGNGSYYVLKAYDWGYVDNHPNDKADLNSFDISWAVDAMGNPVNLPGADFIRVYTGVFQYCGWIGETSTELSKAQDLHL